MKYYLTVSSKMRMIVKIMGMVFCFAIALLWIENEIRPAIFTLAEAKINRMAVHTVSHVAEKVMREEGQMMLIHTEMNEQGKIVLVQPDIVRFNTITARITQELEQELEGLQDIPIVVPLGQIWGNTLVANYGPQIPIYMKPTGMVSVETQDRFEQVGINQTKHRMYLDVTIIVRIAVPLAEQDAIVKTAIPLTEYVIVGDVPNTYVELPQNFLK